MKEIDRIHADMEKVKGEVGFKDRLSEFFNYLNSDSRFTPLRARYMNWPGRALSYKIGQLKIEELRDKSKTELGSKFSLKYFHDAFLKGGFMQLNIFEGISLVNPQFYYSKKVLKGLLI